MRAALALSPTSRARRVDQIVQDGLKVLLNLDHRGAVGADPQAGDGAASLCRSRDAFFKAEAEPLGFNLPAAGDYGVGQLFMPQDERLRARCEESWPRCMPRSIFR